jgi:hypothetical protein
MEVEEFEHLLHIGLGRALHVRSHPSRDAASTLTAMYEQGACSECREKFVDRLLSLDALLDWMRDECWYDANLDLRKRYALLTN